MAGELPAMSIDPIGLGARNLATTAGAMSQLQDYRLKQSLLPDIMAAQKATLQSQTETAPLETQSAKLRLGDQQQESQLKTQQYGNQTLAQVAQDAAAADPDQAATVWDDGMKKAAANGVSQASQYIGHYRSDLAERISDIYGNPAQRAKDGTSSPPPIGQDPEAVARAVSQMPVPQLKQSLGNLNRAISSFNTVKDKASWDAEMQALQEGGIDVSKFLPNLDYSPLNYAAAKRVIDRLVPMRDAMANRAATLAMGGPDVQPKPMYEPQSTYVGVDRETGKPIYHDAHTGQDIVGDRPIGPKPTAAISTFMMKQSAWLQTHPGDNAGALEFANGKRNMSPAQMMEASINQANKELADATLAGATFPNPDQWVKMKTAENYALLSGAAPQNQSPSPTPHPSGMSAAERQQSIANAKAFIKAHPDKRAAAIARLKAAGLSTQGL